MSVSQLTESSPSTPESVAGGRPAARRRARAAVPGTVFGLPGWAVVVIALVAVAWATGIWLQVVHPYIRHDDWPFAVSTDEPGTVDLWKRNLYEGRWLSYAWWLVLGQHLALVAAAGIFVGAYALWVLGTVRLLAVRRWWQVLLATTALLVSVVWVQLIYWPSTLSASMVVIALAVWTLPFARRRRVTYAAWMLLWVGLAVLSYPPAAALVLLPVAVVEYRARARNLALIGAGFVGAYGVGVLTVYTLNDVNFGRFGVELSPWRDPNPLQSLDDLVVNAQRYWHQVVDLAGLLGWAGILGVTAAILAVAHRPTRRRAVVLLAATGLAVGIEAGLTLVTGAVTGTRASLWVWPALVLQCTFLFGASRRWLQGAGVALTVALAVIGGLHWRADIAEHQAARAEYDALVEQVRVAREGHTGLPLVMWMEPDLRTSAEGNMTSVTVRMMVQEGLGVYPRWCTPAECTRFAKVLDGPPRGEVRMLENRVVLRIPPPPAWL